jgi:hypothetical protein
MGHDLAANVQSSEKKGKQTINKHFFSGVM